MAKREKVESGTVSRTNIAFKDFKKRSDSFTDYFVDSEPTNRVKAESDGTNNKADVSFKQLVEGNVMPNRKNGGLKGQTNRRNK